MEFVLKLCEKWAGERMLVGCIYNKLPCGHHGSSTCKGCGIKSSEYIECMKPVIDDTLCEIYSRDYLTDRTKPMTEDEMNRSNKLKEEMRPYQGKILVVGNKEYSIYDANKDFMPCGDAPEIELTQEEVDAWRREFNSWVPFDDELFLK